MPLHIDQLQPSTHSDKLSERGYSTETSGCPPRPFAVLLACNCRYSPNGWCALVQHRHSLPRLPVGSEAEPHSSMCIYSTEKSVIKRCFLLHPGNFGWNTHEDLGAP